MRFFLWLSLLAAAAGFGRANAQAKLDATYGVTVLGLPIGEITWRVDLRDNWFSMEANGATSTLLQIVSRGRGNVIAHGPLVAGKPTASNFALKLDAGRWSDDLEIVFSGGKAREIFRIPSPAPNANIVPLTDAHRVGVVDPMTA